MTDRAPAEWIALDDVLPWAGNPNEGDVGAIALSIRRFGFNETTKTWRGRESKTANHSLHALRHLRDEGWEPFGAGVAVDEDGRWLVAAQAVDHLADEREADAFGVAHNQTGRLGHDDPAALVPLLESFAPHPGLLEATGYDGDELDRLARMGYGEPPIEDIAAGAAGGYREQYGVIVMCADEAEQARVYERLMGEGLECKVVVT